MDFKFLKRQMNQNALRIKALASGTTAEEAVWRPNQDSWSLLEVINHLYDEEREDFRVRLEIILHSPEKPWPKIDPQGWVVERNYNDRELKTSLEGFLNERKASLEWLDSLDEPDWSTTYEAAFGPIKAGDMFAAWATHDQLHMRQMVEIQRVYSELRSGPYTLRYAGEW